MSDALELNALKAIIDEFDDEVAQQQAEGERAALAPSLAEPQGVVTPVKRMERWQVPAHELDDTELDLEYEAAAAKFDSRGEHEHERKRRRAAAPEQETR